jgi:hypothetical protein
MPVETLVSSRSHTSSAAPPVVDVLAVHVSRAGRACLRPDLTRGGSAEGSLARQHQKID